MVNYLFPSWNKLDVHFKILKVDFSFYLKEFFSTCFKNLFCFRGDVYKIHYLMLALVFIKSVTLTFHAINMHYIAVNGIHEAVWAILYYITYVLRGLLLIISILLVGTGWTFIKYILSENERRLFVIVIPLQVILIRSFLK